MWYAVYKLQFHNGTQGPLDNFMIQFNKNSFGLAPGTQNVPVPQLEPGSTHTAVLPLVQNPTLVSPTAASSVLQVRGRVHMPHLSCHTCNMIIIHPNIHIYNVDTIYMHRFHTSESIHIQCQPSVVGICLTCRVTQLTC